MHTVTKTAFIGNMDVEMPCSCRKENGAVLGEDFQDKQAVTSWVLISLPL